MLLFDRLNILFLSFLLLVAGTFSVSAQIVDTSEGNLPQPVAESALDYVALVPWGHIQL